MILERTAAVFAALVGDCGGDDDDENNDVVCKVAFFFFFLTLLVLVLVLAVVDFGFGFGLAFGLAFDDAPGGGGVVGLVVLAFVVFGAMVWEVWGMI